MQDARSQDSERAFFVFRKKFGIQKKLVKQDSLFAISRMNVFFTNFEELRSFFRSQNTGIDHKLSIFTTSIIFPLQVSPLFLVK